MFRRGPIQSISVTERLVKEYAVYIDTHHASSDPEVRQTVAEFRVSTKQLEGDLVWYRQFVASSTATPRPR